MKTLAIVLILAVFAVPAVAVPVVFTGYDVGSTSLPASPLATAAAAAFDLATGPLSVIDFETGLPPGVSLSAPNIIHESTCTTPDLHCYATSGVMVQFQCCGQVISFATPIDSFGAYFTGWQIDNQTLTITYSGGATTILNMGSGEFAGGTRFFGFIDAGAAITSIHYDGLGDAVGIDDLRYGSANAVPEPSTLLLLSTGFVIVAARKKILRTDRTEVPTANMSAAHL